MRLLVTAIGSMSAECAIKRLKEDHHYVVGCDIYPGDWHYETILCDEFVRAPYATNENEYISFLIETCHKYRLNFIIPLTDLEIDVINRQRHLFQSKGITLCMQSSHVLRIVRDKYRLSTTFLTDQLVPSIRTHLLTSIPDDFSFPCIAKPYDGRSSEGLMRNVTREQLMAIEKKEKYIVQEQLEGDVYTVDYCRCSKSGRDAAVPRKELLRTKNGAGLTIKTISDEGLIKLVSYIGNAININGCVNLEFIKCKGKYYLIDINPRFSAGVAFSMLSGYDMVLNHIRCFNNEEIDPQIIVKEQIIIKRYVEFVFNKEQSD